MGGEGGAPLSSSTSTTLVGPIHQMLPLSELRAAASRDWVPPFADGKITEVQGRKFYDTPLDEAGAKYLGEVLDQFVEKLGVIQRLHKIHQSPSSYYSSLSIDEQTNHIPGMYDQNRGAQHSMDVGHLALHFAKKGGLSGEQSLICMLTGVLHDIGHPLLSHTGEEVLHARGFHSFNHDLYTAILASQDEVRSFCLDWGIEHKALVACIGGPMLLEKADTLHVMQEKLRELGLPSELALDLEDDKDVAMIRKWSHFHVLVQDHIDTLSYQARDSEHSEAREHSKLKIRVAVVNGLCALDINDRGELSLNGESGVNAFEKTLRMLGHAYQERPCRPAAGVANEVLLRILDRAHLDDSEIITGTDEDMISRIHPVDHRILSEGIDRHFKALFAVPPIFTSKDGVSGMDYPNYPNPREMLHLKNTINATIAQLQRTGELPSDREIFVALTPPLDKKFDLGLSNGALKNAQKLVVERGDGEAGEEVVLNHYDDDFFTLTLRLEVDKRHHEADGGPCMHGFFKCVSKQILVATVQRKDDIFGQLQIPSEQEELIRARLDTVINDALIEKGYDHLYHCKPIRPDNYAKSSAEREA